MAAQIGRRKLHVLNLFDGMEFLGLIKEQEKPEEEDITEKALKEGEEKKEMVPLLFSTRVYKLVKEVPKLTWDNRVSKPKDTWLNFAESDTDEEDDFENVTSFVVSSPASVLGLWEYFATRKNLKLLLPSLNSSRKKFRAHLQPLPRQKILGTHMALMMSSTGENAVIPANPKVQLRSMLLAKAGLQQEAGSEPSSEADSEPGPKTTTTTRDRKSAWSLRKEIRAKVRAAKKGEGDTRIRPSILWTKTDDELLIRLFTIFRSHLLTGQVVNLYMWTKFAPYFPEKNDSTSSFSPFFRFWLTSFSLFLFFSFLFFTKCI